MPDYLESLSSVGWLLLAAGAILVLLPLVARILPSTVDIEKTPPILLYVYRKDNFVFITSPLLLLISFASILWVLIKSSS